MAFLRLVVGAILLPWPVRAEVRQNFENCEHFFYKSQAPTWPSDAQLKHICQYYENHYYFATLYHQGFRIPYWSAYTLKTSDCNQGRRNTWYIEPQLTSPTASPNMLTEAASNLPADQLKRNQALSIDYESTSFDRGHLNPNLFQCDGGRDATFTLTNAVPMDPCFNRVRWSRLEVALKEQLTSSCQGIPYLVTGAVPDPTVRIPDPVYDTERDHIREYKRVSVPSHIWTAVCCDNANQNLKFSFAFLAENREESLLRILKVSELEDFLADLYNQPVQIFADDCNADSQKGRDVLNVINNAMFKGFRDLIENNYILMLSESQRNTLDQSTQLATTSMDVNQMSLWLTKVDFSFGFKNLHDWDHFATNFPPKENLACVLSSVRGISRVRRATEPFLPKVCTLEEQKGKVGSPVSAKGWPCVWQNCNYHSGTKYMWCSTSHASDWDYCCSSKCAYDRSAEKYQCRSGDRTVTCSPQYSAVTISGEPCRADHPCGLYDESYYWCYTDYKNNWEHCCSPLHHCDRRSYSYTWCYVDNSGSKWEKCVA